MTSISATRANINESAAQTAERAGEALRNTATRVGETLKEGADRVQTGAEDAARDVGAKVSARPLTALAATLAVGALAGYFIGRRH